jgi:hypothetical protein
VSELLEALRLHKPLPRQVEPAPGLRTWHGPNGGECALLLDTLPVHLKYELTVDLMDNEVAEVVLVCINGHQIEATDFASPIRAEWGRQCMVQRGGL